MEINIEPVISRPSRLHLTPIDTEGANASMNDAAAETESILGPLSPSGREVLFTPYTPHSSSRFSGFSRKSFTSEDFKREPEEAEGMEFQNVRPGRVSIIRVLSKLTRRAERNKGKKVEEKDMDLDSLNESDEEEGGELVEKKAEIHVNGEAYVLHADGVFRPHNLCMSVKAHFKGYAVRSNGIFKPLGGSPAAIDANTLYRVTPTNKYSQTEEGQEYSCRALHRIKSISQLLSRGTSGHEEFMYVYDPHWEGFVRIDETRRFPREKAMLKPGDLRASVHTQDSEELFASADNALQRAVKFEEINNRQSLPATMFPSRGPHKLLSRSLTVPSKMFLSPRAPPEPMLVQVPPTPAMYTKPLKQQNLRFDDQEDSWLHIDMPQLPTILDATATSDISESDNLPAISPVQEIRPIFPQTKEIPTSNGVIYDQPAITEFQVPSSQVSPLTPSFHKPIIRKPIPHMTSYAPALRQLINECDLVLCLCGTQSSSRPRLARISVPNSVSPDFDDMDLFLKMHEEYQRLRGFWRRWFSLKGLKHIDLIEYYHKSKRQTPSDSFKDDNRDFSPENLLDNYFKPYKVAGERHWVEWVHRLNNDNADRYALQFIEGWRSDKIAVAALCPIALSITAGVLWCFLYPNQEWLAGFTLGILVILLAWPIVGLLAMLSYNV